MADNAHLLAEAQGRAQTSPPSSERRSKPLFRALHRYKSSNMGQAWGGRLSLEMNFLNSTALQGAPISSSPETSTNLLKVTGSSRRRTFAPKPRA